METIYSKMHSVWNAFYVITVAYTFTIVPIYIRKGKKSNNSAKQLAEIFIS